MSGERNGRVLNCLLFLLFGIAIGLIGGFLVAKVQPEPEVVDWQINLILPKTDKELKKQILFNACSQTMLNEMLRLGILKLDQPEKVIKKDVKPN